MHPCLRPYGHIVLTTVLFIRDYVGHYVNGYNFGFRYLAVYHPPPRFMVLVPNKLMVHPRWGQSPAPRFAGSAFAVGVRERSESKVVELCEYAVGVKGPFPGSKARKHRGFRFQAFGVDGFCANYLAKTVAGCKLSTRAVTQPPILFAEWRRTFFSMLAHIYAAGSAVEISQWSILGFA